jgi:hemin uptake protein HemP
MLLIHDPSLLPLVPSDTAPCPANVPLPAHAEAPVRTPRLSSRVLLGGGNEVEIDHGGVVYRLRQTSLGKLILTK